MIFTMGFNYLTTSPLSHASLYLLCPGPVKPAQTWKWNFYFLKPKPHHKPKCFLFPPWQSAKPGEFWNKLIFILCKYLQATRFVRKVVPKGREKEELKQRLGYPWSSSQSNQRWPREEQMKCSTSKKSINKKQMSIWNISDPVYKWFYLFVKTNLK